VNRVAIARELVRVARLLVARYGHTLWVDPHGKVVDLGTTSMHYNWIAKNLSKLFPDRTFSDSEVFDAPLEEGWIHVRSHGLGVSMTGNREAIERNRGVLGDIIAERWVEAEKGKGKLFVDVSHSDTHRDTYMLPDDYDTVKRLFSI
jgi:hypothetical protein